MVEKYWTRMLLYLKEILGSRLFLNVHLTVSCELDQSATEQYSSTEIMSKKLLSLG